MSSLAKSSALEPTASPGLQSLSCPCRLQGPRLCCEISFSQRHRGARGSPESQAAVPLQGGGWDFLVLLSSAAFRRAKPSSGMCTVPKQVHRQMKAHLIVKRKTVARTPALHPELKHQDLEFRHSSGAGEDQSCRGGGS